VHVHAVFTVTEKCGVPCEHNMEDHPVSMAKKTTANKICPHQPLSTVPYPPKR